MTGWKPVPIPRPFVLVGFKSVLSHGKYFGVEQHHGFPILDVALAVSNSFIRQHMFGALLHQSRYPQQQEAIIAAKETVHWGEFPGAIDKLVEALKHLAQRRVALRMRASPTCLALLAAFDELLCDTFLVAGETHVDSDLDLANRFRLSAVVSESRYKGVWPQYHVSEFAGQLAGSGRSSITLLTSGTEGQPKAVRHTWDTLTRPVRFTGIGSRERWLLAYEPHLYAGLQVILQCLLPGGTLVAADPIGRPDETIDLMLSARVNCASATPSFWRRLILFGAQQRLANVPLRVITLGGEAADQPLLDGLHRMFPQTRLVHIYATSELGRCFSVTDGCEGFPVEFLQQVSSDGIEMKIESDELLVRSANCMLGYDDCFSSSKSQSLSETTQQSLQEWLPTGDLVEVRDRRVLFIGRRTEIVNVGGNKVHPLDVERVLREMPEVLDARVYGRSSSIAGQLVACEIVVKAGTDETSIRQKVISHCTQWLTVFQRPRVIEVVSKITLTKAGKASRKGT